MINKGTKSPYEHSSMNHSISSEASDGVTCICQAILRPPNMMYDVILHQLHQPGAKMLEHVIEMSCCTVFCGLLPKSSGFWQKCKEVHGGRP